MIPPIIYDNIVLTKAMAAIWEQGDIAINKSEVNKFC